ncbi:MAG: tRNA (cytidine(34)-2'-O)-methyltransferase [Candidatus Anoxychlamydiales bacterium]|nr:tRNA (cytidine(34)-2'-O)-methyltransferase [Candidatus Anoxychlamydiales bacterium]NGX40362.1 tRNA (cytidine(34)-2'-O)-methyltransferase [Candidatus Anoxychlamydiales bacterium]
MQIILFKPEIPQNTGNIIRTCYLTNASLSIVTPASFSLSDRNLKRAGLDYFKDMKLEKIQNLETYLLDKQHFYFFSSKATKTYSSITYEKDAILIFGSETTGLPKIFFEKYEDKFLKIPMKKNSRCLNLSNSVAIALYEALRQNNFSF